MGAQSMNLIYSSSLDKIVEGNSSFDRGVLRVCYTGRNRNKSSISKEAFERCIGSIYNVPIVCRYDRDTNEIGSHDMEVVRGADDRLSIVNLTQPVGVIPESAQYYWEDIEEKDGTIHEYLCVDALLWKRQEAYSKIKEDGITDESMEINVLDGYLKDGIYVIERFEFTAFCLLGTAEPCYESASLLMFSEDSFREQYHAMMKELKEMYHVRPANDTNTIHSEGGNETLDKEKMELLAKYGLTAEQLSFDISAMSCEELEAALAKFEDEGNESEGPGESGNDSGNSEGSESSGGSESGDGTGTTGSDDGESGDGTPAETDDGDDDTAVTTEQKRPDGAFALNGQILDGICEALCAEKIETVWGEESRYWLVDFDDEKGEVYAYDSKDWKLYGFSYTKNGDNIVIDFESKKRMKFAIVEYDEGEQPSAAGSVFTVLSEQFEAERKAWNEKFDADQAELSELRAFKSNTEEASEKAKFDAECESIFAQFTDLEGNESFCALRENRAEYDIETIEEKCFAIRGRVQTGKFSVQAGAQKAPKLPVEKHAFMHGKNDPYGGVFQQYGIDNA